MDFKSFDLNFKDVDLKKGIVSGYFASFGTKDSDGDIIEQGSFQKTIKERGPEGKKLIKWLLDHDTTKAIGKVDVLREDSFGLYYEGKVGRHTLGKDFLLMVEDEIINQHSFGYKVIKDQYDSQAKANYIKELKMYEGSSIQFLGANENTPITGIKNLEDALTYCAKLEKFINTSTATDETLNELHKQLKSLQATIEPFINTQQEPEPINIDLFKSFYKLNLS